MASIVKNGCFQGEEGYNCPGEWESSAVHKEGSGCVFICNGGAMSGMAPKPHYNMNKEFLILQPYKDRTCAFVRQNLTLRKGQPYKLRFYGSSRVDAPKGTLMVCIDSKILFEKELSHDWVKYSVNFTATSTSSLLTFYNYGLHPNNDNIQDGKTEAYWYATSISSVEMIELPDLFGDENGGFNLSLPPIKMAEVKTKTDTDTESDDEEPVCETFSKQQSKSASSRQRKIRKEPEEVLECGDKVCLKEYKELYAVWNGTDFIADDQQFSTLNKVLRYHTMTIMGKNSCGNAWTCYVLLRNGSSEYEELDDYFLEEQPVHKSHQPPSSVKSQKSCIKPKKNRKSFGEVFKAGDRVVFRKNYAYYATWSGSELICDGIAFKTLGSLNTHHKHQMGITTSMNAWVYYGLIREGKVQIENLDDYFIE
jgi:hypothetical protein